MSILENSNHGWFISHENLIKEIYGSVDNEKNRYELNPELFNITKSYKPNKVKQRNRNRNVEEEESKQQDVDENEFYKEVKHVNDIYVKFYEEIKDRFNIDKNNERNSSSDNNDSALKTASAIYHESGKNSVNNLHGANIGEAITKLIQDAKYLFPANCRFYCKDILNLSQHLNFETNKYDMILLDPPWWNKYIRRKRKHTDHAYTMMYNDDLKSLPLENYLKDNGLIVVWCTNSQQHLQSLKNDILPKWGVEYSSKWYWVKVTKNGETICPFMRPPRKQPFEQIIFACKQNRSLPCPPNGKLVVSVPSALHSHKPPLIELLKPFLSDKPECLELFARYLLPNWTSYGNEVLKLQHYSLYIKK